MKPNKKEKIAEKEKAGGRKTYGEQSKKEIGTYGLTKTVRLFVAHNNKMLYQQRLVTHDFKTQLKILVDNPTDLNKYWIKVDPVDNLYSIEVKSIENVNLKRF